MAGDREIKEGRHTEEEPSDDFSKPRKVQYHSKWKSRQDAIYWINVAEHK